MNVGNGKREYRHRRSLYAFLEIIIIKEMFLWVFISTIHKTCLNINHVFKVNTCIFEKADGLMEDRLCMLNVFTI